jgi:hypothetical protein
MATMLLFYSVQTITLTDAAKFSKVNSHAPYQDSTRNVTSVVSASHIYTSNGQLLLTVKNWLSNRKMLIPNLVIGCVVQKL